MIIKVDTRIPHERKEKKMKKKIQNFMKSEKGLSNVVATILLILVAVLAVALIWTFVKQYIDSQKQKIEDTKISKEITVVNTEAPIEIDNYIAEVA